MTTIKYDIFPEDFYQLTENDSVTVSLNLYIRAVIRISSYNYTEMNLFITTC